MINWNWFRTWSLATATSYVLGIGGNSTVRNVYEDEGNSVILNCSCKAGGTWFGPGQSVSSSDQGKDNLIPYTERTSLNPYVNLTNVHFHPIIATEECNLEITNFSRFNEGTYICQNFKNRANVFHLFVSKLPKVIVTYNILNGTLKIECGPSEVPNNNTFIQLEHRSEFNEYIRYMDSSNDGPILSASIENAGLQDTGIYICKVSNGELDENGRKFQSGKTLVELKDAPVFLDGDIIRYVKLGEVISISTVIHNGHEIRMNATIQSKRNIIHKLKIKKSFVIVQKMFHGSNITLKASKVSFQLDLMSKKNITKYTLEICNTYGCRDIKIDIRIDTSKTHGRARSKYQDVEIVFAALAVLSVLGIGMGVAFLIWKRVTDKDKSTLSQAEDLDEDNQGQSVENRLYQSREIVNTDNPAHVLQAQANGGYVYHAIASSSQSEPTRNDQSYLCGSQLNYSEVVFEAGPSSDSNIIHGANDKTIYSEIDLAQSASFNHDSSDTSSEEDFIYIDGIVNPQRKNEIK